MRAALIIGVIALIFGIAVPAILGPDTHAAELDAEKTMAKSGKLADARRNYERALTLGTNGEEKAAAQLAIAQTYADDQDWGKATDEFRKVLFIEGATVPQKVLAQLRVGVGSFQLARYPEAGEELSKVLAIKGVAAEQEAEAHMWIGLVYHRQGNIPAMRAEYAKILDIAGAGPRYKLYALSEIGRFYLVEDNAGQARLFYTKLLDIARDDLAYRSRALYGLGQCDYIDGQYPAARQNFTKAIEAGNAFPVDKGKAQLSLGMAYHREGNREAARRELLKVLDIAGARAQDHHAARLYLALGEPKDTPDRALTVLFVCNSYLHNNNVPEIVERLSESSPKGAPRIITAEVYRGGTSLMKHWKEGFGAEAARGKIAAESYDYVVLQEYGPWEEEEFVKYATLFHQLVKSKQSKTILFASGSPIGSYREWALQAHGMNVALAKKLGVPVAPGGLAWMRYLGDKPTPKALLDTYAADRFHPGPKTSYLYACTLYAAITGRSPVGLTNTSPSIAQAVSASEAGAFQTAAWEAYKETAPKLRSE